MSSAPETASSRRRFLTGAASASTIAVVAVDAPTSPAHAYDPGRDETKQRYRETDDVKAFYRTNGYETLKK
jgi:hypothetical protein